ncbi:MAG TPA: endonuclease/exonuclease/phosphatase family protein [Gaiellaceae bacterium]|jgi:endonuclease/exonuclease/phosphatase family metal-dependent hydrolase|nr:endonuclease/exonuclease/phosphatase family protein [Gaiellaceae bacterium]
MTPSTLHTARRVATADDAVDITRPPQAVLKDLRTLRAELDTTLPAKQLDRNLLVGTWNIRVFGDVTKSWHSGKGDAIMRDLRDVCLIAEIVSRFDVVAIQEVRDNLRGLRYLLKRLGPDWGFTLTDVTQGNAGNGERLAFVFDTRRVTPSGLACELVEPEDGTVPKGAFARQFARTPYAVSFVSAGQTFILVTLHVTYGKNATGRIPELKAIAQWLSGWAEQEADWHHNVIALGDFNIDRDGDPLYKAFTSTGLTPAPQLASFDRSIDHAPGHPTFYDQIAWFTDPAKGPVLTLDCTTGGNVDFVKLLPGHETVHDLSYRISDHYPLWVEFAVPSADE